MTKNAGSNLKLISTTLLLGCAIYAFWSDNILAAVLVFVGYVLGALNALASRLSAEAVPTEKRLEDLGEILKRLSRDEFSRVSYLARAGKKIEAIRELREITGAGLKDSKEAVDLILAHDESNEND